MLTIAFNVKELPSRRWMEAERLGLATGWFDRVTVPQLNSGLTVKVQLSGNISQIKKMNISRVSFRIVMRCSLFAYVYFRASGPRERANCSRDTSPNRHQGNQPEMSLKLWNLVRFPKIGKGCCVACYM